MVDDSKKIQTLIYYGQSMAGVFRPGDDVLVCELPFHCLGPGDIIVFDDLFAGREKIVHRIIEVRHFDHVVPPNEYLITQGDHNPLPDCLPVGPERNPKLVIGFRRNGRLCNIARGPAGMLQFRLNQTRLKGVTLLRKGLSPLRGIAPLQIFNRMLPPLEKHSFGPNEFIYCGRKAIAERSQSSRRWRFRGLAARLFFTQENLFAAQCDEDGGEA